MSFFHSLLVSNSSGIINVEPPYIEGISIAGQTIHVYPGSWSGSGIFFTYQWKRNGIDISGETSRDYIIKYVDEGTNLTCLVTASVNKTATSAAFPIPALFSRSEVLEVVVPTLNVTLTSTNKVSAITGLKGVMSFTQASDSNKPSVVTFFGSKAFKSGSGAIRLDSTGAFPQQYFSAMALIYGSNGDVFCNKTSSGFLNFGITSDLVRISNTGGTILTGTKSLSSNNTIRTPYWNYAVGGFNVGIDGVPDTSNATSISSTPSGTFRILNSASGANAHQLENGCIVFFNRALTNPEQEFWSQHLMAIWLYGYVGKLPWIGNAENKISNNFNLATFDIQNWSLTDINARLKSFNTTSTGPVKGVEVTRLENPQRNLKVISSTTANETRNTFLGSATSTGMTISVTQAQPFTVYGMFNVCPYYMPPVNIHKILKYTTSGNNVCIYVDKTSNKIRMQSEGSIGSSGIEIAQFQPYQWIIFKAVFNGINSELVIDINGTEYSVAGSLSGTTGLGGSVELMEDLSGYMGRYFGIYNGVPTSDEHNSTFNFMKAIRNDLPRYDGGFLFPNDNFQTYHRGFGNIVQDSDGYLYVVYSRGDIHAGANKVICMVKSTTPATGKTHYELEWSSLTGIIGEETVIINNAPGHGGSDPNLRVLSDGRFILNYWEFPFPSVSFSSYSDDKGITWSTPVLISNPSFYDFRSSGPIKEDPDNGWLYYPFHGEDQEITPGIKNNLRCGVLVSKDRGNSWTIDSIIPSPFIPTGSDDWEEINIGLLPSDQWLALIRKEVSTGTREIWKVYGTRTEPIVWGTPTLAIDGVYGNPEWILDNTNVIHMTGRAQLYEYPIAYYTSSDEGATFVQKNAPEPFFDYWIYGSLIQLLDGRIGILWFQQIQTYWTSIGQTNTGKAFPKFKIL